MVKSIEEQPLTENRVVRAVVAIAFIVTWCGICTGAYYQLQGDAKLTAARVDRLEVRQNESDRTTKELIRAVDKATTIMERLDKKLGSP
jgi:allophanate hydrolase subunit 1